MQVKITLEKEISEVLEKEAKALGLKVPIYIKLILGQHVAKNGVK